MKKRIISLLLVIAMSFSLLVSCGDDKTDTPDSDSASDTTEADVPVLNPETEAEPDTTEKPEETEEKKETETEKEPETIAPETDAPETEPEETETEKPETEPVETETEKESEETTPPETEPIETETETETTVDTEPTSDTEPTTDTEPAPDTEPPTTDTEETPDTEPVREVTTIKYVALGDSIAEGYGLPDYEGGRYPTLLGNLINDLEYYDCETYNYSVSGDDSARLINILKKGTATELTDADIVTISIGANNIMGVSVEKLGEYYLYSMIRDEALKKAKLKQIYQELKDVTEAGTKRFIEDIPTIIRLIKKVAPDARIVFQTVYNPFKNMELILEDFGDEPFSIAEETDKLVKALNDAIYAAADENGYEVCDVYTAFEAENEVVNCELYDIDLEDIMSSMMAIDPHPTEKGHILIADTIFAHLALK